MQLIEFEDALAQLHIAIEQGDMLTDRLYQVVVDADRYIVTCEGSLKRSSIVTLPGIKGIIFYLGRERGSNSITLLEEGAVQSLKSLFPHPPVCAANEDQVVSFCQFDLFARFIRDGRELQVSIINHGKNGIGSLGNFSRSSQDRLYFCGTHMWPLAIQIAQLLSIEFQAWILAHELIQFLLRQCQNFRLNIGGCC